jgi:hypothetical protein
MSTLLSRDQCSVPNFASLMAKEELEDASCYYPASGRRSLGEFKWVASRDG